MRVPTTGTRIEYCTAVWGIMGQTSSQAAAANRISWGVVAVENKPPSQVARAHFRHTIFVV